MFPMVSRRMRVIGTVLIIVLFILLVYFAIRQSLGRRIEQQDVSYTGNTTGNLYNEGVFCEGEDGTVYFANPFDSDSLYSMSADETNFKKLTNSGVSHILSNGNFLFYYMQSLHSASDTGFESIIGEYGIFRIKNDGQYGVCLARDAVSEMQQGGSYIYFAQGSATDGILRRVRVDSTKTEDVYDEYINPCCYQDGILYYTDSSTNTLYELNVENENATPRQVANINLFQPIASGHYIYFMDGTDEYRICRLNITDGTVTTLTQYGTDMWNMNDTYIFYDSQTADVPGLYRCRLDGSDNTLIMSGVYNKISLTANYLYFTQYETETLYHMPLTSSTPSVFIPDVVEK